MERENRFKNLNTRLNEQINLCKLETKRFKIILTSDYTDDTDFTRLSRGLQITHSSKLAKIGPWKFISRSTVFTELPFTLWKFTLRSDQRSASSQ